MIKGTDLNGRVVYCIYPDGTAEFADKAAIFRPDKSGHIAGGAISWHYDEAAQKYRCTLSDVILSWENLSDDVKNAIKPYIGGNGNWWVGDTDTGTKAEGENGYDGKNGMIILRGEWGLNTQYRNDSESTEEIRYLSVAMVRDDNTDSGWRAYKCLQTHISTLSNAPGNTSYWEEFPLNVATIFTSLIIAKDAKIEFLTNNEIRILDANNNVTAGVSGAGSGASGYRFWVGAATGADAPTRFAEDGSGRLANGNIKWNAAGNTEFFGGIKSPFADISEATIEEFWEDVITSWANNFFENQLTTSLIIRIIPCRNLLNGQVFRIHALRRGILLQPEEYNGFYDNGTLINQIQLLKGDAIEMVCICYDNVFHSWDIIRRYKCRPYDQ
jgi:hypothetical protein